MWARTRSKRLSLRIDQDERVAPPELLEDQVFQQPRLPAAGGPAEQAVADEGGGGNNRAAAGVPGLGEERHSQVPAQPRAQPRPVEMVSQRHRLAEELQRQATGLLSRRITADP